MNERMRWDKVEPVKPCASPEGHGYVDLTTMASDIPVRVFCPRCNEPWQIVTFKDDE